MVGKCSDEYQKPLYACKHDNAKILLIFQPNEFMTFHWAGYVASLATYFMMYLFESQYNRCWLKAELLMVDSR